MRNKTFDRLAVMSLIVTLFLTIFISRDGFNFLSYSSAPTLPIIQQVSFDELVIDDGTQVSQIIQKNDIWYVKKDNQLHRADQERVKSLASHIQNLKRENVDVQDQSSTEEFGLGQQKIIAISPSDTITIYVGDPTNLSRNYVRLDGENRIVMAEGFSSVFSPSDYRDLSVGLVQDESLVNEITIIGIETSRLKMINGEWFLNGKKIEKEQVSFFINDLKTLEAQDVIENAQNLPTPFLSLQVNENNQLRRSEFYRKDGSVFIKVSGNGKVFRVSNEDTEFLQRTNFLR